MPHLPIATADELGLAAEPLARASRLLAEATSGAQPTIPGAAFIVGRGGRTIEPRFFGRQGPEPDASLIRDDALFLLASISKPFTYLAGLMMVERGQLDLDAPVVEYVPEFAAHGKSSVKVLHLFTHTSGLPDMLAQNADLRRRHAPLDDFVHHVCHDTPLLFQPGADYSYQSMGTLMVAELVRRLSGEPIDQFLRRHLFDPLGLASTRLGLDDLDPARVARIDVPAEQEASWNWNSDYWRKLGSPWGGMLSSPAGLAVLMQLMLDGGSYAGVRTVSPAMIERMTTNRFGDLPELPEMVRRTRAWGLGWQMNHPSFFDCLSDHASKLTYGHHGSTGTLAWVDPDRHAFAILLTTAPRDRHPATLLEISSLLGAAIPTS